MNTLRTESEWRKYREMSEELREICVDAVGRCDDFPEVAKTNKDAVGEVEISNFSRSYIDFLDNQIALSPRGEEWTKRLRLRRFNLAKYEGKELASCRLSFGAYEYWIKIDPTANSVVHWELCDEDG